MVLCGLLGGVGRTCGVYWWLCAVLFKAARAWYAAQWSTVQITAYLGVFRRCPDLRCLYGLLAGH